jgi:hypothetical protein
MPPAVFKSVTVQKLVAALDGTATATLMPITDTAATARATIRFARILVLLFLGCPDLDSRRVNAPVLNAE